MKKRLSLLSVLLMLVTAAMTLSLTACSDKNDNEETNPDKPSPTLPTGNQFTVGPTGGTVETGSLKLEIPSGTFTGGADVYVDTDGEASATQGTGMVLAGYAIEAAAADAETVKVKLLG